jgi:hypothetical protein
VLPARRALPPLSAVICHEVPIPPRNAAFSYTPPQEEAELTQEFHQEFHNTYLPQLKKVVDARFKLPPIKEGELVLLVTPNVPRYKWNMGRVTKVTEDKRGAQRVVTVRNSKGNHLTRPARGVIQVLPPSFEQHLVAQTTPVMSSEPSTSGATRPRRKATSYPDGPVVPVSAGTRQKTGGRRPRASWSPSVGMSSSEDFFCFHLSILYA